MNAGNNQINNTNVPPFSCVFLTICIYSAGIFKHVDGCVKKNVSCASLCVCVKERRREERE